MLVQPILARSLDDTRPCLWRPTSRTISYLIIVNSCCKRSSQDKTVKSLPACYWPALNWHCWCLLMIEMSVALLCWYISSLLWLHICTFEHTHICTNLHNWPALNWQCWWCRCQWRCRNLNPCRLMMFSNVSAEPDKMFSTTIYQSLQPVLSSIVIIEVVPNDMTYQNHIKYTRCYTCTFVQHDHWTSK